MTNPTADQRLAPWLDFAGNDIHAGDMIVHPDGVRGRVLFEDGHTYPNDAWFVDYGDGSPRSRLCLQIGDKGRAVVTAAQAPAASKDRTPRELLESARGALRNAGPVTRELVATWIDAALAAPETRAEPCPATWQPFKEGPAVPCTLPAGHAGKHRAPEPFAEQESFEIATQRQMDFTIVVTRNASLAGLKRNQFLRMVALSWDAMDSRENGGEDRG